MSLLPGSPRIVGSTCSAQLSPWNPQNSSRILVQTLSLSAPAAWGLDWCSGTCSDFSGCTSWRQVRIRVLRARDFWQPKLIPGILSCCHRFSFHVTTFVKFLGALILQHLSTSHLSCVVLLALWGVLPHCGLRTFRSKGFDMLQSAVDHCLCILIQGMQT